MKKIIVVGNTPDTKLLAKLVHDELSKEKTMEKPTLEQVKDYLTYLEFTARNESDIPENGVDGEHVRITKSSHSDSDGAYMQLTVQVRFKD